MRKVSKDIFDKFEYRLFGIVTLITLIGFLAIYSATKTSPAEQGNFLKQIYSWILSIILLFGVTFIPTRFIKSSTIALYAGSLILLVAVLFFGKIVGGQKCWIHIAGFSFQPSEMAKISVVLALAQFLSRPQTDIESFKDISIALAIGLLPVFLIMMEPDLGSSFIFFGIILFMLFWNGISMFGLFFVLSPGVTAISSLFGTYYLIGTLAISIAFLALFRKDIFLSGSILAINVSAGFFVDYVYRVLSPHQQRRIMTFIDPTSDPLGAGYNSLQAKIAIGSGGFWGKGYLSGRQTQLHFIPAQWTDFIFCTIGEEFGLVGSVIVLFLFAVFFVRLLKLAQFEKDKYYSLIVIGSLAVFFVHFIVNVGMAIGIMPVIGIPLPFISYGGSALLSNMLLLGIILNIYRNRVARD